MGAQGGIFLSKSGSESIISLDTPMDEHMLIAKTFQHPCRAPPQIPVDLKFAATTSASPPAARLWRERQWNSLETFAAKSESLDAALLERMPPSVKMVAGSLRLGFLSVLIQLLRWPDWQLPSLFTRGFHVCEHVEASNVYPDIEVNPELLFADISSLDEADKWNTKLSKDTTPREFRQGDLRYRVRTTRRWPPVSLHDKAPDGQPARKGAVARS